jgi:4'-phosphopantetheinyl transferase EntD
VNAVESPGTECVARAFAALFAGLPVIIETGRSEVAHPLYPEERRCIAHAVSKRQAEFSTGRVCARAALASLGIAPGPLMPGTDRCPSWPAGVVGSITHADTICVVAVARAADVVSLGIDVESALPLDSDLEPLVCTRTERRWLDGRASDERGAWSKLIFSAKESFYKCQYPRTGLALDFLDVELCIDPTATTFSAHTEKSAIAAELGAAGGRWAWSGGLVLTRSVLLR